MDIARARSIAHSGWAAPVVRPAWQRYAICIAVMLACIAAERSLEWAFGSLSQVGVLYLAGVFVAAVYLGLGPGVLSVVLGTLLTAFLVPPSATTRFENPSDLAALALFAALGTAMVVLAHWRRSLAAVAQAGIEAGEHSRELEARIRERERVQDELRRSNAALGDFAHLVAHDLKQPLRGIAMTAEFLREDAADRLDGAARARLDRLATLPRELTAMLDALMEYSRAAAAEEREAGGPPLADLSEAARGVVQTLALWLEEQHAEVVVEPGLPALPCSRATLMRVLTNLITNGVKYNTSDHKRVEVGARREADGRVTVCVRDNGIGIPEAQRERVFAMFARLREGQELGGGTGAGLALTRRLIEREGGRVWVEPGPDGRGSVFCFTLGKAGAGGAAGSPARAASAGAAGL